MAYDDLTEKDRRVYEYLKIEDFESKPWSTPHAAKALGMDPDEVYESLSSLAKNIRDRVWIHYKDGGLRISAE